PRNDVAKAGVTTTAAATREMKIARVLMLAPLARSVREKAPDAADTVPRGRPGIQPGTYRSAAGAALLRVVDGQHVHRRGDRSPFDDDVELRSLRSHVGVQHREPDRSETWTGGGARERSHDLIAAANLGAVLRHVGPLDPERLQPLRRVPRDLAELLLAKELHVLVQGNEPVERDVVRRPLPRLVVDARHDHAGLDARDLHAGRSE